MKQLKNIDLAKTTTVTSLLKLLILIIILTVLSGGDSFAESRKKYKIIVTRPGKNVTTQLRVYAENQEEARENVALNGWQILSIEEQMETVDGDMLLRGEEASGSFTVNITKIGQGDVEPLGDVDVAEGDSLQISLMPGPCEKMGRLLFNGQEFMPTGPNYTIEDISGNGYVVVVFDQNGTECADNGILSKNLNEIGALHFPLGKFSKELSDDEKQMLSSVLEKKVFVIIGHTDDVRVIPNEKYKNNLELSVKRSEFAAQKLKESGYSIEDIKLLGMGPAFPVAPNKEGGQPLNRRAVLYERRN